MTGLQELWAQDAARDDMLVLVDGLDRPLGVASKLEAHQRGLLHRAFSVVLVREGAQGLELLLASRAEGKYHSEGLWANSCCSHPRAGEELLEAAERRVGEELGCGVCDLCEVGSFVYRAVFSSGLSEHEYDHVLLGRPVGEPEPDPAEVGGLRWERLDDVAHELAEHPEHFAAWAPMVLSIALRHLVDEGLAE
jgi:isopentenyl-diphosphate delta-isomerase